MRKMIFGFFVFFLMTTVGYCQETQLQNNAQIDYLLDGVSGGFYLYSGLAYRSALDPKDEIKSFEELKTRVSNLPNGARLHWSPSDNVDSRGKPLLF